jgi:hypothetical protein|tara:strand:+ start:248 stop:469 length:222 start_codon:yes stop_codon:yes gene_type:complete
MSDSADVCYAIDCYPQLVDPYDEQTGEDIEGLGPGKIVVLWVPDSRRDDIDRNDDMRRLVTGKIDAIITAAGG